MHKAKLLPRQVYKLILNEPEDINIRIYIRAFKKVNCLCESNNAVLFHLLFMP